MSSGHRRASGLLLPIEIRADVSAPPTAALANEQRFDVAQPNVIRPPVAADRDPMAAPVRRVITFAIATSTGRKGADKRGSDLLWRLGEMERRRERALGCRGSRSPNLLIAVRREV